MRRSARHRAGVGHVFERLLLDAREHPRNTDGVGQSIQRVVKLVDEPAIDLHDDWNDLRTDRFDLIFASLVLQHIDPAICGTYLSDFARMAPSVYLLTRAESDFDTNVLGLVGQTGLFVAGECVVVDHDPATHQLRVLGTTTFDAASRVTDGKHYELLLRPRP